MNQRNSTLKYIAILLVIILFYLFTQDTAINRNTGLVYIFLSLLAIVISIKDQQNSENRNNWTSPSNFTVLGMVIVSFQYLIDYIVGYKKISDFVYPEYLSQIFFIAALGLVSYFVGYSIYKSKGNSALQISNTNIGINLLVFLQIFTFAGWIYTVDFYRLIIGALYYNQEITTNASIDGIFEELFNDVNIVIMATLIFNNRGKKISGFKEFFSQNKMISWILIILYCIIRLVSGDRGPCLYTILLCYFTFTIVSGHRLKLMSILILLFTSSFVINIIGMARSFDTNVSFREKISKSILNFNSSREGRFSERTVSKSTEELATSVQCNEYAIAEIEKGNKYHYGEYQLLQALSCVPFVPSYIVNNLKVPTTDQSSSLLITERQAGRVDLYQIGTTCFADFYLDFGYIGVVIGMIFVGVLYRRIDCLSINNSFSNPALIMLTLIYASQSIYIGRCGFMGLIKPILVVLALFYINKKISSRRI